MPLAIRVPRRVLLGIALLALPGGAALHGQGPDAPAGAEADNEISVTLVTMGPGAAVWERFAHNALWIRDPATGLDRIYNYGLFSFEQDGFLLRFVRGDLLYSMAGFPAASHLNAYLAVDRSVWLQELNLTPAQRVALRDFLIWNDRPENREYAYDYYYDNCSTRVRDALDRVLGGQLRAQTAGRPTGTTFRFHTERAVYDDVWTSTGLLLGLGQPVDGPIDEWEEMFLPMKLQEHARHVTISDASGAPVPLVASETTLYASTRPLPPDTPPRRTAWYLLVGVLIAAAVGSPNWWAAPRRAVRVLGGTSAVAWTMLAGFAGALLAFLWFLTDHSASYRNENLFLFNPIALPLAVMIPMLRGGRPRVRRAARWLAVALAGSSLLGLAVKVLPWFDQANGELIALALPPNVAVAWLVWRRVSGADASP